MMIMSRPAPIPLVNFPRTSTLNGCGVVPRVTVYPSPIMSAVTVSSGTASGQSIAAACLTGSAWAGAVSSPPTRARAVADPARRLRMG